MKLFRRKKALFFKCVKVHVSQIRNSFKDLQGTTIALDLRVTALEENGGSDGNSSVAELEVRVETLEATAADHEMRISAAELDIDS